MLLQQPSFFRLKELIKVKKKGLTPGGGGRVLPMMAYKGRLQLLVQALGKGFFKESRKYSTFEIDSYLKDTAFTAVKRDAKF